MKITVDFNDGLSIIHPVSCFVEFELAGFLLHGAVYVDIVGADVSDVILCGDLVGNIPLLKWLTPRLIAEGYMVSYVADMKTIHQLIDLPTNFIILKVELNDLKGIKNLEILKSLKPTDVVLYVGGFDELKPALHFLDTKARLAFNNITPISVISAGIYDMFMVSKCI